MILADKEIRANPSSYFCAVAFIRNTIISRSFSTTPYAIKLLCTKIQEPLGLYFTNSNPNFMAHGDRAK